MAEDKEFIWARDPEGRTMLEEIAEWDSRRSGRVNLSATLHRILVDEHERMRLSTGYSKWKKERDQTRKV